MRRMLDKMVRPFGLRVVRADQAELLYRHSYAGGYEEYRATQIRHNKRKLKQVWADRISNAAAPAAIAILRITVLPASCGVEPI